ncbi:conserved hypothetical protein [Ricinus communis]|uniref:Uncharacterized protein n=1 Tax=Ricinus communis TaxID=3988 RepID=B9SNJ7_RICCO|nr:conserved hypothetical protein [Ricinus communis]
MQEQGTSARRRPSAKRRAGRAADIHEHATFFHEQGRCSTNSTPRGHDTSAKSQEARLDSFLG